MFYDFIYLAKGFRMRPKVRSTLIASKGSAFQNLFVFAAAVLSACVAVLKGLPVLHHSADCIFCYFGISDIILGCFEYTVLLKGMLEDVSSAAFIITAHEQTQ